ncbi:MAG: hypothetical protein Q8L42_00710, partial [Sulfurimicrobium sp.]|nr:hypothetical protein [Sulfurimicrobium sp.]
ALHITFFPFRTKFTLLIFIIFINSLTNLQYAIDKQETDMKVFLPLWISLEFVYVFPIRHGTAHPHRQ